jgi:hypothetical protein
MNNMVSRVAIIVNILAGRYLFIESKGNEVIVYKGKHQKENLRNVATKFFHTVYSLEH